MPPTRLRQQPGSHVQFLERPFTLTPNQVGWHRLPILKPVLKPRLVSALETKKWCTAFKRCFQIQLAPQQPGEDAAVGQMRAAVRVCAHGRPGGRSLHSSTSRLNVSASCGIGGAFRGVYEVAGCSFYQFERVHDSRVCLGGFRGYQRAFWVYVVSETAQDELKCGRV